MNRREYLLACMGQPADWLKAQLADPSPGMRPVHLVLIRIALKRKAWR